MKTAVVLLPGLNRDHDMITALEQITSQPPILLWETDTTIPNVDVIVIPGGFSYGDYLRCGAIAARSPVMQEVVKHAQRGVKVLGVCNGFQILLETKLLPGALLRNNSLRFVSRMVELKIENNQTSFTHHYQKNQIVHFPVAHHDGNYFADQTTIQQLEDENRIVLRYSPNDNPNGSLNNIAGIINKAGNVLGMMPHPENFIETVHGGTDGRALFTSLVGDLL